MDKSVYMCVEHEQITKFGFKLLNIAAKMKTNPKKRREITAIAIQ